MRRIFREMIILRIFLAEFGRHRFDIYILV